QPAGSGTARHGATPVLLRPGDPQHRSDVAQEHPARWLSGPAVAVGDLQRVQSSPVLWSRRGGRERGELDVRPDRQGRGAPVHASRGEADLLTMTEPRSILASALVAIGLSLVSAARAGAHHEAMFGPQSSAVLTPGIFLSAQIFDKGE